MNGNERQRNVTTNSFPSGSVTSTNVSLENLVGSNSLHVVYSPSFTSNGTPHYWMIDKGITNDFEVKDNQDLDGDGMKVWQEYIADTDPTNNTSFFPPLRLTPVGEDIRFEIDPTSTQRQYHIEGRTNLLVGTWTPVTNAPGTGGAWSADLTPDTDAFFRSKVTLAE